MVQQKIDELRENDDFYFDEHNEKESWISQIQVFFDATTLAERITALLRSQDVRLGTMIKIAYFGLNETEDMPYDPGPTMDLMTNSVQNELKDDYIRVISASEEIFLNKEVDTVEGINNLLEQIQKENESNEIRDEEFEKKFSKTL